MLLLHQFIGYTKGSFNSNNIDNNKETILQIIESTLNYNFIKSNYHQSFRFDIALERSCIAHDSNSLICLMLKRSFIEKLAKKLKFPSSKICYYQSLLSHDSINAQVDTYTNNKPVIADNRPVLLNCYNSTIHILFKNKISSHINLFHRLSSILYMITKQYDLESLDFINYTKQIEDMLNISIPAILNRIELLDNLTMNIRLEIGHYDTKKTFEVINIYNFILNISKLINK